MDRSDTEPLLSEECYKYLVDGLLPERSPFPLNRQMSSLLKETFFDNFGQETAVGAEYSSQDEEYSIKIQKVPVSFNGDDIVPSIMAPPSPFSMPITAEGPFPPNCLPMSTAPINESFIESPLLPDCFGTASCSPPLLENEVKVLPMVPSNMEFPGNYKFSISFEEVERPLTKSTPWVHSTKLKKLFVRKEVPCPIRFKTEVPPPPGSYIRALMMFCKMEDINEIVSRCLRHEKKSQEGDSSAPHVLTCSASDAVYEKCPKSGRYSVRFPIDHPQAGTDFFVKIFKFICYTSCAGGMNRRQTQIIFTLEHCGQTLGRRKVECRICACPGRDINNAEHAFSKKIQVTKPPAAVQARKEEEDANASTDEISSEDEARERKEKAKKVSEAPAVTRRDSGNVRIRCDIEKLKVRRAPDDEVYAIVVRGRENFLILSQLKEALELKETLSSDYLYNYRNTMPPSGRLQDLLRTLRPQSNRQEAPPPPKKVKREQMNGSEPAQRQSTHTIVRADVPLPMEDDSNNVEFERCVLQRTITMEKLDRDIAALVKQEENEE